jgi:hypothetical protein
MLICCYIIYHFLLLSFRVPYIVETYGSFKYSSMVRQFPSPTITITRQIWARRVTAFNNGTNRVAGKQILMTAEKVQQIYAIMMQ